MISCDCCSQWHHNNCQNLGKQEASIILLWTVSVVEHLDTILVVAVTVTSITQVTASL